MFAYESLVKYNATFGIASSNIQADFPIIKESVLLIRFGGDFRVPNTTYLLVHFNFSPLFPFMIIGLPSALQSTDETKSFYTNFSLPLKAALSYVKSFLASSFNLDSRPNILNVGNVKKTYKDTQTPLIFLSFFKVKHAI